MLSFGTIKAETSIVVRATQKKAVGVKVRKDSIDVEELNKRVIEEMEHTVRTG